jgi:hypothetical protein
VNEWDLIKAKLTLLEVSWRKFHAFDVTLRADNEKDHYHHSQKCDPHEPAFDRTIFSSH